jgi:hypothetical protein
MQLLDNILALTFVFCGFDLLFPGFGMQSIASLASSTQFRGILGEAPNDLQTHFGLSVDRRSRHE